VNVDYYGASGQRWVSGATLVYGPIAAQLVAMSPHSLAGRTVLDAGAGTGAASAALAGCGASPIATDLSFDMLSHSAAARLPQAVADIRALPLAPRSVDDAVAAFVLNHLVEPVAAIVELIRVVRPGGVLLAAVYSTTSRSAVRDRLDEVAGQEGWRVPQWYLEIKASAVPLLGSATAMAAAASAAGLEKIAVDERAVDVGVTGAEQLVSYRLSQAQFAGWLDEIGPQRAGQARDRIAAAIRPIMEPYRPTVVFLTALVPG
jgi:ubiquinone/menaquinone biosynthesis C-methylase UbiE